MIDVSDTFNSKKKFIFYRYINLDCFVIKPVFPLLKSIPKIIFLCFFHAASDQFFTCSVLTTKKKPAYATPAYGVKDL